MSVVDEMEGIDKEHMEDNSESCSNNSDACSLMEEESNDNELGIKTKKVFLPGTKLEADEELVVDESAYRILHQAQTGAPCLSFDIIKDNIGNSRETYPLTMYILAGTQATKAHLNNLHIMKMSNLFGINVNDDSDSSDSENEDEAKSPIMNVASIKHQGCVNRVRCTQIGFTTFAASWSELGRVSIWNLDEQLKAVENSAYLSAYKKKCEKSENAVKPIFTFKGHLSEGYGLDWCSTEIGTLASGDCKGNIHIWRYSNSGANQAWCVDQRPYNSHAPFSVEDLQWSPNERHVLASCSTDKSIKIWDTRINPQSSCMLTATDAHSTEINVISWNKKETQFLLSGDDYGIIRVWDLRHFNADGASPLATFKQHTAPVTSVEWHPDEATVFASGGADNQITQWDLSVEAEQFDENEDENVAKLPPQLLFIHQGQTDVKELHWHPQCPGTIISTALSGFNIFRTISV